MSWKSEVVVDSTWTWHGNALRFATKAEAEQYVADLAQRWTLVTDTRVVESNGPVNYRINNNRLEAIANV
jgi:hypothetical protein